MYGITEGLSKELALPLQRIGVRNTSHITEIVDENPFRTGPEMITPFGICLTALKEKYNQLVTLTFNGEVLSILNPNKKIKVLDILLEAGIDPQTLFPKRGETLVFKVNEERVRLKGEPGIPAQILLNGQEVTLQKEVQEGDSIEIVKGKKGKTACITIGEYLKLRMEGRVYLNGEEVSLPLLLHEGKQPPLDEKIKMQEAYQLYTPTTIGELLKGMGYDLKVHSVKANLENAHLQEPLALGDRIEVIWEEDLELLKKETVPSEETNVKILEEGLEESVEDSLKPLSVCINHKWMQLPPKSGEYLMADLFEIIHFDLTVPKGTVQLRLNQEKAPVTAPIKEGDQVEIFWEK